MTLVPGFPAPARSSPRVAGAALLAALAAAAPLVAGCGALGKIGAGSHNPAAKAFTVSAGVTAVVIDGGSGSVDVTGTAGSTVSVSQRASYSSKPPAATHVMHGTTLTVSYNCPAEIFCGVSYDAHVPRGVAVTVSTSTGAVTLTSLAGTLRVAADAGLITAVDLRSPVASFNANAGGVLATFSVAPRSLTAMTNVGPITLTVPGTTGYLVAARTVVGSATVTVRRSGNPAHSISARSDLGSISISPG
jgi:hypothetical protein